MTEKNNDWNVMKKWPGPVAQLVGSLIADRGVVNSITARTLTFMEIDLGIFSAVILLPLIQKRAVVSYKPKYVH